MKCAYLYLFNLESFYVCVGLFWVLLHLQLIICSVLAPSILLVSSVTLEGNGHLLVEQGDVGALQMPPLIPVC